MYNYLTKENFKKTWEDSEQVFRKLFTPFREYERIARNRPHPGIDKAYPKVTDGTLASIIQETPKRYIQQTPTGTVRTESEFKWLPIFATYKLVEDILPNANCQADVLQKSWAAGSKSMTYGSQPGYVFFEKHGEYFGPDFKLPYITDVYLEKGKLTDRESNVIFIRAWYQTSDIENIISKEKKLAKDDPAYQSTWDLKKLEEIKDKIASKEQKQKTPTDNEASYDSGGVEIIHGFQKGVGASFYSYSTEINQIVRTKKNPDPRGVIPIHYLYANVDLSNPLGRGVIELSGGMQNLLDSHTQAFQYIQALEMNPPVSIRGNIKRGTIKFVPNAIWDLGNDPNARVEPVNINTTAMSNFPNTYGLIKSQILNLNSSMDTSVSSEVGNPGFSKTPAGVNANQERLGVSDNYLRKQYESWFQDMCETMLNLFFAETNGVREEYIDSSTADKLRQIAPELFPDPEEDKIIVDYDLLGKEPITFEVDASTSTAKDDKENLESLLTLQESMVSNQALPPSKMMALHNKIINKFGIEDPEDLQYSKEEIDIAKQQEQMPQMGVDPTTGMPLEEGMQPEQPEMTEEDMFLAQELNKRGFDNNQIEQAIVLLNEGQMEIDEIIQVIGQPTGVQANA